MDASIVGDGAMAQRSEWQTGFVGIDSEVLDRFGETFTRSELEQIQWSADDIAQNITDLFEEMSPQEALAAAGATWQGVFDELAKVIGEYIPLLRASVTEYGDETYMEAQDVCRCLGLAELDSHRHIPKLLMNDGTCSYALLQVAAWKMGMHDTNVRLWYVVLRLFLAQQLASSAQRH
jgi:hypothetical protein